MIDPKDIIKKGQMEKFKKVISRIEKEARSQAIEEKDREILSIKEHYLRDLKECGIKIKWIWIEATRERLEREIEKLKKEMDDARIK